MNLFILPSWYPSSTHPLSGIFTREQVDAIAELSPDINVIVSTWGHCDYEIPTRRPWRGFTVLKQYLGDARDQVLRRGSVTEVFNPAVNWNHRLPFGGVNRLLGVNRRNFELARRRYGRIDLIHAHVSYPGGYIAYVLGKEFQVPYILTEHMGPFPVPSLMKEGLPVPEIVAAFTDAACSIAVSPSLAARVCSFGLPRPEVIPNLVDERRFSPGPPESRKFVFFTLCGLIKGKGIEDLLEAIARWSPSADRVEFRIAGDGEMKQSYQALAQELGIGDRVRWLGKVSREQAPRLFRECHAFVMPSHHETFGVVYAEAIASGKPVIATRCGGPEFIVNTGNGRLVNVGDIDGLAADLEWMTEHWRQFDAASIRSDFERRFSRPAVVGQLKALYASVMRA